FLSRSDYHLPLHSFPTRRSSDLGTSPSHPPYDTSQKPHSDSPDHPHTTMSDAESPENTGQTPPNQSNHSDSSPHPQDAPSCRTCAPVTANAARVLGMSHPQPNAGYVKYHHHETTHYPYSQPSTTTGPRILSPK